LSSPPVSLAEVSALKTALAAKPPGEFDSTLQTLTEVLGLAIEGLRQIGADPDELAHDIELLLRASNQNRRAIREARDVLVLLGYPTEITTMMTQVAKKARKAPPTFAQRMLAQANIPTSRKGRR
jgi:hypothetical protein